MSEIFRRHEVLERLEGDEELLRELLQIFLAQSAADLGEMKAAWQAGDTAALGHRAHSIKGAAAGLGATLLSRRAAQLEEAAKRGDLSAVPVLLQAIQDELERFEQAVL